MVHAITIFYATVFLLVLYLAVWWSAYGHCHKCNLDRSPRCGCDPEGRRKPWRNHGK